MENTVTFGCVLKAFSAMGKFSPIIEETVIKKRIQRLFQTRSKEKPTPPKENGKATISERYLLEHVLRVTNDAKEHG